MQLPFLRREVLVWCLLNEAVLKAQTP
jgi:hypothetical protein